MERVIFCGIPIESKASIFPARSSLRPRSTRDAYVKGLDNSTPESYSKLRRFLLRGQAAPLLVLFPFPPLDDPSPPYFPLLRPPTLTFHPPGRARELPSDSLTKCRFPSFPWQRSVFLLPPPSPFLLLLFLFPLLFFGLFPLRRPSDSSAPSRRQQSVSPHLTLLALPSFPFSLSATSFFYLLLFNRRSLVCPCQILRAISAGVYHLPRKTKVVKMNSLANFNLYLVDLI